jgi:WD40 repeat protein
VPVRLFLSYARNDDETFVARLHAALTAAGFSVWFDRVSMPSRSLTFHQEIRDAVTACDRLVLVVGPNAVSSDYVTQEWRFAYFEALKCVNPIVRADVVDAAGQKIDAYSLIPEDLRLVHAEDFRDDAQFDAHTANLIRQLSDPLPPAGKLVAVPELPPHYLDQPARIAALRDILLADLQKPVVVSGAAARVGLQGMGGIGKSVLASALAHRPEVRRAFPDGVYWVTLGQEPDVPELQRGLARALGNDGLFVSADAGKEKLRELLAARAALLVLDDVWHRGHAEAFNVLGARGRLLLTTRDAGLVTALAAKENHYQVQLPTEADAQALLAKAAGVPAIPDEAREVVDECGRLPLGLALCGGMVQGGRAWRDVLEALREHDLEYLSDSHPAEEQHRSVWKAMDVSVRALAEEERERFAEFAVFGLDTGAPEAVVETLWGHTAGMTPRRARDLLMSFRQRSLVDFDLGTRRMGLHDLLHHFATGMAARRSGSLAALHGRLLEAYRKACADGWASGPDDGYFLQSLVGHLIAAGEVDDAVALLTDLPWIEAKCKARLAFGLQGDYRQTIEVLPEAQAELAEERRREAELARWTQTLIECAEQRRAPKPEEIIQSVERWSDERIAAESKRIVESPTRLDRLKAFAGFVEGELFPQYEFGKRPGFVVQHAFNSAPRGPVHASAARRVEGVGAALILRRWGPSDSYYPKPALLRTLEGHTESITSVSVTADGRRAVSGSHDKTLRVWNLETGQSTVLHGHTRGVYTVSVTPDGRRALSAGDSVFLRVWDLEAGESTVLPRPTFSKLLPCTWTYDGHTRSVYSVSVTPDGRRAVSGSGDNTLRVWNLETGQSTTPRGHTDEVRSVSVTPDGQRAVSGSGDKTVRVWNLETGESSVLRGHTGRVLSVSVTPDGRRAVSGSFDKTLRVWNLETGESTVLQGYAGWSVNVTPDGRRAVFEGSDNTLRVWNLETGESAILQGHAGGVESVSATSDGRRVVSSWSGDKALQVWNLEAGESAVLHGHMRTAYSVSVTPDGRRAVSAGGDKTVRVWNPETGESTVLEGHTDGVTGVSVALDGRRAVSGSYDKTLRVWGLETGKSTVLQGHTHYVRSVAMTPDGRRAVSASEDKTLRVWNLEAASESTVLQGHAREVWSVSVTPDGQRAVSGSWDKTVRVWDLETGGNMVLQVLQGHTDLVRSVSVTPDGLLAVSGGDDKTVRVWNLETGKSTVLQGHANRVFSVSVSPDGRWAASGSGDNTLRVWDLETGAGLAIARINAACWAVAMARKNLIVAGTDLGEVLFFDLRGIDLGAAGEDTHA